jgi:hypothetical protein
MPRWSLDVLAGFAHPVGRFDNTKDHNPVSGQVHPGSIVEYSLTYHLNHHWGITALAGSQRNNSDADILILPGGPGGSYLAQFDQLHWKMTRLLTGGVYTLPLNRKQNLDLLGRVLAGVQQTETSAYTYQLHYPEGLTSYSFFSGRTLPWTLSYQADAGFEWKILRWVALLAYGGYNGCRPAFTQHFPDDNISINGIAIPTANGGTAKLHFPTGSLLLRGGIQFNL